MAADGTIGAEMNCKVSERGKFMDTLRKVLKERTLSVTAGWVCLVVQLP